MFAWIDYSPVRYGDYVYPNWADALGWLMAISSVIFIPAIMIKMIYKEDEASGIIGVRHYLWSSLYEQNYTYLQNYSDFCASISNST